MALGFGGKRKGKGAPFGNKNAAGKRGPSKAGKVLKGTAKAAAFGGAGYVAYKTGEMIGMAKMIDTVSEARLAGYEGGRTVGRMEGIVEEGDRRGGGTLASNEALRKEIPSLDQRNGLASSKNNRF